MLQQALSGNASTKMKNIVVTIQREQDIIIRDMENELLIVQGTAGSGKTSIALHRIAFLLYQGSNQGLSSNNILIISPNNIFSKYISSVLPELGEENVEEVTFDEIVNNQFNHRFSIENKITQLESIITAQDNEEVNARKQVIEFKGSMALVSILEGLIQYYERRMIPIEDVYYNGKIIETKTDTEYRQCNIS
jgi:DNA helicase-2/ATP-dependent DNA helicase PcrA